MFHNSVLDCIFWILETNKMVGLDVFHFIDINSVGDGCVCLRKSCKSEYGTNYDESRTDEEIAEIIHKSVNKAFTL